MFHELSNSTSVKPFYNTALRKSFEGFPSLNPLPQGKPRENPIRNPSENPHQKISSKKKITWITSAQTRPWKTFRKALVVKILCKKVAAVSQFMKQWYSRCKNSKYHRCKRKAVVEAIVSQSKKEIATHSIFKTNTWHITRFTESGDKFVDIKLIMVRSLTYQFSTRF